MKKTISFLFVTVLSHCSFAQNIQTIKFNQIYQSLKVEKTASLIIKLSLEKNTIYQFSVLQKGMDVVVTLSNKSNPKIIQKDSDYGKKGPEFFEYVPTESNEFTLTVSKLDDEGNPDVGIVDLYVKKFTKDEMAFRQKAKQELIVENTKNALTADIDHFYEAFDLLKNCKNHYDSLTTIQNVYLDRATNGLLDFIKARNLTADEYVEVIYKNASHYASVRENAFEVKKSEPLIQEVFDKLKSIYGNFKPFKVCFAIGAMRTGGTTSDNYILLGTELMSTGKKEGLPMRIKGLVAHECVHTQQKTQAKNVAQCNQLYQCLQEGSANFIGQLLTGTTNYTENDKYGDTHENELWNEFKSTLCSEYARNWLYNGDSAKDRPADLGYYIGYKITQAYYNNATDKQQAIIDIIEVQDAVNFLQKSGYEGQKKQ
jgi:Predicted Zn-dependent protease (DUF2268)